MRKSILLILCCLLSTVLYAGPVSKEQARQTASQFLAAKGGSHRAPALLTEQAPVLNAVDKAGNPYIYAFNAGSNGGYVLVSGDDRFRDVLAYSASGSFDNDQLPAHVKAWLQGYVDEMQYYESIGYQPTASTADAKVRRAIKSAIIPLLATAWGQGTPYNNNCPEFVTTSNPRCVTGCVATAMAQLMYYNAQRSGGLPAATTTEIAGYTCERKWKVNLINKQVSVSAIPAETALDWNNMLASYASGYTDDQANAVATLMQCCGASVQMDYADADNGGSGAALADVAPALKTYFGYDESTTYAKRANYTLNQWVDKVYAELAVGRPVLYGGQSSGGGHAFVIDGYDGDEMFHVNWGWNGSPDSYYALSVLNPDDNSGIGASTSNDGYSYGQEAVFHATIGSTDDPVVTPIALTTSNFRVNGQQVSFAAFNETGASYSFYVGIGSIDDEGVITQITVYSTDELQNGYGYNTLNVPVPTDADKAGQTLKIVPISMATSGSTWYTGCNSDIYYWEAVYDANGVPTLTAHPAAVLTATDITFTGSKYKGEAQPVDVTVSNSGDEFYGVLYLFASTSDTKGDAVNKGGVTVQSGKSATLTFEWTPSTVGTYNVWVATDEDGDNVIGSTTVQITVGSSTPTGDFIFSELVAEHVDETSQVVEDGHIVTDVYSNSLTFSSVILVNNTSSSQSTANLYFTLYRYVNDAWSKLSSFSSSGSTTISSGGRVNFGSMDFGEVGYGRYKMVLSHKVLGVETTYDDRYIFNLTNGYEAMDDEGNVIRVKTTDAAVTVADDVTAVDLSNFDFTDVTPNSNPNTLYIIGSEQTAPASLSGKNVVKGGVAEQLTLTDGHAFCSPVDFTATAVTYTRTETSYLDKDTQQGWTTIVLPFAATGCKTVLNNEDYALTWFTSDAETNKNFWVMEFSNETDNSVLFTHAGATLEANKPYLMALPGDSYGNRWSLTGLPITFYAENADIQANAKAATTGTNYKFIGTTVEKTDQSNIYTLNADGNAFVKGTASVSPFRAYFAPTSTATSATSLAIGFGGGTTALKTIDKEQLPIDNDQVVYDLQGRRIATSQSGSAGLKQGLYIVNGKKVVIK